MNKKGIAIGESDFKTIGPYWVNTSDNLLIYDTLKKGALEIIEELKQLIERKELVKSFR